MSSISEGYDTTRPRVRRAPLLPVRERCGHQWALVYLKSEDEALGKECGVVEPTISWADGIIHLRDRRLVDSNNTRTARDFVQRAFVLEEVYSVELDWAAGMASIRYRPGRLDPVAVLERLAAVTREEQATGELPDVEPSKSRTSDRHRVKWFRHEGGISTWEIVSETAGRLRFRHPSLAGDRAACHRVEADLTSAHGVNHVHARPLTGSLLVHFDPAVLSKRHLVQILDDLVHGPAEPEVEDVHPPAVPFALANGSVGLAAVGEFAMPALLPASAALLVLSNVRVVREAGRELQRGQVGLPVLYTAIIAGTLGTGQFLGAACMSWMYKFWRYRHRLDQSRIRRHLLPSLSTRQRFAQLRVAGRELEVPTERLRAGDRIVVKEGTVIPADGRLRSGPAVIDERLVTGVVGLIWKRPGDQILAGSRSAEGEIEIEVSGLGRATRAARLGRELAAASVTMPTAESVTAHGEAFARRAVAPTLAAAGVGLIVGDLTTASAILRPDYATAPGLGSSLEVLHDVVACARDGVMIRDACVFERLATADVIVFDHQPALERSELEVASVDGDHENTLLRLAAAGFRDLADERAGALKSACHTRTIPPLSVNPSYLGSAIELCDGSTRVFIEDAPRLGSTTADSPIDLFLDGQRVGRISFRHSSRPRLTTAVAELRRQTHLAIGLLSDRLDATADALAAASGVDFHRGGLSSTEKAGLLRSCRERGLKVVYVGEGRLEPQVVREAHIAISLSDDLDPENVPGHILARTADLAWLPRLLSRARAHVSSVRKVHKAIVFPNLICVGGAFLLGFTSFVSVVITNMGTWAIYSELHRRRRRLELIVPPAGQSRD